MDKYDELESSIIDPYDMDYICTHFPLSVDKENAEKTMWEKHKAIKRGLLQFSEIV